MDSVELTSEFLAQTGVTLLCMAGLGSFAFRGRFLPSERLRVTNVQAHVAHGRMTRIMLGCVRYKTYSSSSAIRNGWNRRTRDADWSVGQGESETCSV